MKTIFVFLISGVVFFTTFYIHFNLRATNKYMVAFVGKEHSRLFEHMFSDTTADLWVFGHHKRKSKRMRFGSSKNQNPFEIFRTYEYDYMLLLQELNHIPILKSNSPIQYVKNNKTMGIHWSMSDDLPNYIEDVMPWLEKHNVIQINL